MGTLDGRVALVTGAGQGVGEGIAYALAAEGARVMVTGRTLSKVERTAAAALDWHREHGDRCQHLVFTSPALDRDGLEEVLDSCLLTDAEYSEGPEGWRRLPPAFAQLLDHAT